MSNSVYHPFMVNSRPQLMPRAAVDYEGLLDIDAGCSNSSTSSYIMFLLYMYYKVTTGCYNDRLRYVCYWYAHITILHCSTCNNMI